MTDDLNIRSMTQTDVEAVIELTRGIWHKHYPEIICLEQIDYMLNQIFTVSRLKKQLASSVHHWWVAEINSTLVGSAHALLKEASKEAWLEQINIDIEYQRAGIGQKLIVTVSNWAYRQGYAQLALAVNKRNQKAIRAYLKYGFLMRNSLCVEIGQGFVMDDFVMEKPLLIEVWTHNSGKEQPFK